MFPFELPAFWFVGGVFFILSLNHEWEGQWKFCWEAVLSFYIVAGVGFLMLPCV